MTEKHVTGGSAPPYDQPPIPTNPRTTYEPTSPPPQTFSPSPQYPQHPTQPQPQHDIPPYQAPDAIHHQPTPQQQPTPQYTEQKGSYYGPGQQPQQQGIPMQGLGQQQGGGGAGGQYQTVVPLQSLGEGVAPVDCPCCRSRALTRTEYVSGNTTMGWAVVACLFCVCLVCLPFMTRSLKDVEHHCGHCGVLLATWHNSGRVVVHQHS